MTQGLVQIQDVILTAESANEILADKAVALTARKVLKYRDVWDVWYLVGKLNAEANRDIVTRKFADYGTSDVEAKAKQRRADLAKGSTAKSFLDADATIPAGKARSGNERRRFASENPRRQQ